MRQLRITQKITKKDSLVLNKYLNDIGKIGMINTEEEGRLAKLIRKGDNEALNKIAKSNLRFVISVAKQYQNQGLPLEDLINEGNLGLIKAAKRFDETKGFKFISYAVWWIRQSILQAIVEYSRLVRLPLNKVSSHSKVNEAYYSFVQEFHREPSIDELSEALNMKNKDILLVLKNNGKYISVDAKMGGKDGDSAMTLLDTLACHKNDIPESNLLKESMFQEIGLGMKLLNQRECNVVNSYYGLEGRRPMTLEEIGDECSLTRERVRQIKERALRRIRNSVHGDNLRTFLD